MTFCQSRSLVKQYATHVEVATLRCRCWHCENCVGMRSAGLRELALRGRPTTFLTLTVWNELFASPEEAANALRDAWQKLARVIKRRWKLKRLPYLAVFEATAAGWPHLHILGRFPFLKQSWVSAMMRKLIGSPVVDIRRVKSRRGVARYVSKYVSKAPRMWAGCKRYWRSLDWLVEPRKERERPSLPLVSFWMSKLDPSVVWAGYIRLGWEGCTDGRRFAAWGSEGRPPPW